MPAPVSLDVVIFGGGVAGLWLLDELVRAGYGTLLLEAHELGSGQTIASQGIIHGGLKYSLGGLFTPAAKAIRDMPLIWRRCLAGEAEPDLSQTRLRAEYCHLWRTNSLTSRLAMIGARAGLRVAPVSIPDHERPAALAGAPGPIARLDEQVIEPASLLTDLSQRHPERILKIESDSGLEFERNGPGAVRLIRLLNPESGEPLDLAPSVVILTAGAGSARLRELAGLTQPIMQRRPLHMSMVRGPLPELNGHCVDGTATRITVTTTRDFDDRTVWQIGGQLAERGVELDSGPLIARARSELDELVPGIELAQAEWATYRVDRAELAMRGGGRPDDAFVLREGSVVTAWPTKLALVPELARRVLGMVRGAGAPAAADAPPDCTRSWPRPIVALPPWETSQQWTTAV